MKVIFAVDDSKYSDYALESVSSRPWPTGTQFRLLSVLELSRQSEEIHEKLVAGVKQLLKTKADMLTTLHPGSQVDTRIMQGSCKEAILQEAGDWGADHIVVGSHGRKGVQKFLLGSVAEGLLGQAHCTVEIVRLKNAKSE
ncbi:MAG: universal stress protein [Candidatus Melainabacteria bacterium]|nr:universal stress protein [Candidatus Melainabacteria bacterium]